MGAIMPFFYCPFINSQVWALGAKGGKGTAWLSTPTPSSWISMLPHQKGVLVNAINNCWGDKFWVLLPLLFSCLLDDNYFLEEEKSTTPGQIKAFPTPSANHDLLAPCCFHCWSSPKLAIKISHSQSGFFASPMLGFLFKSEVFACSWAVCACEFTVHLL